MVALPKKNGTIHHIDAKMHGGLPRPYLGMSGIGDACWRKLWYGFHWVNPQEHPARTQRIFDIGHLFEQIAISDLKAEGCFVFRVDCEGNQIELTGKVGEEQEEFIGFAGHAKGHPDGRIIGLAEMPNQVLTLELKTMKEEKFLAFKKQGIEKSNPVYYGQTQRYMLEMGCTMCFFLALNKNTSEYWWEFIPLDREFAEELKRKEKVIIISDEPPERGYSSGNYNCNWCDYYAQCHAGIDPQENCRTCDYSDLEEDGIWSCSNPIISDSKDYKLSTEEQRKGCSHWEKGWGL